MYMWLTLNYARFDSFWSIELKLLVFDKQFHKSVLYYVGLAALDM